MVLLLDWIPIDWVTGTIAAVTLFYIYLTWNYDHWKKRGIAFEKPQLFFGNYKDVFLARKSVGMVTEDIYKKLDGRPYMGLFRFRTPTLLVAYPDIIKTILVKEFPSFDRNAFLVNPELDPLFARSPFFSYGPRWKQVRSLLSPAFTSGKVRPLFPHMDKVTNTLVKFLETKAPKCRPDGIEAKELCSKFTTEVVANCAFGIEAKCFQDVESSFYTMNRRILNPDFMTNVRILINMFFPALTALLKVRIMTVDIADFYRSIVKDMISYRESTKETRYDYLNMLMQLKEKALADVLEKNKRPEDAVYTHEDMTAHAVTFIIEGFETSSIAMSFLLYELAMNVDVQNKLRVELQEAMEKTGGKFDLDIINSLPYLNMVLTESLRMHPPLLVMEKLCTKKCVLPKKDGGTMLVEPGTLILIPVGSLHYDPKYYPEPNKFDPERFSEERKDSIPNYTYLPWGEGPRVCIGMRFAQAQVKVGVSRLLLNYDIRPTAKTPRTISQSPTYFLASAEGGLWLDFIKRN